MRTAVSCAVIALVTIISTVFVDGAQTSGTKFTSAYTDLQQDCKDKFSEVGEGQDMPVICQGPEGYAVHVDFSACCEHVRVEGNKNFAVSFPKQKFVTAMNRKLEWRLANGKPFAVIFRIDRYKGDISMDSVKAGEVLIIKGLNGFLNIDHEVEVKRYSNPNLEARRLADQGYMQRRQIRR